MKIRSNWKLGLLILAGVSLAACGGRNEETKSTTETVVKVTTVETTTVAPAKLPDSLLPFKKEKQLVLGELDKLERSTSAHIQLNIKDKPKAKREPKISVDPVGWHNYKMPIDDSGSGKEAWLMNRGHLVGYQFSGLDNELRNLTPMTALLNTGSLSDKDSSNQNAMLFYENNLADWINAHPNDWLDYKVTPIYQGDELIPRQVELQYAGIKSDGTLMKISFGTKQEKIDEEGVTHVILENTSPNARIDYATGNAEPLFAKKKVETTEATTVNQEEKITVYVANKGKSDVYWYYKENMPGNTNKKNIVEMTEAEAKRQGKTHTSKEKRYRP
ncbi:DNA/RNA non-specific endonuclease [Granulicatella adiacens]|uniref:DNA/RNA non-specific endonuclease n=1 Tax=Granulicatella adiacens TaxID=46124 RepID=UPI00195667DF|nr:DNA/RNA non-specific endonuclease [Granulicatella adiacens]VTX65251.1 DNA/RNA non-specific endonuclease [Granulicatella adiacens]